MPWYTWFLWPFSWIYRIVTTIRNLAFDRGLKKVYHIPVPSICVGNLSVGGTGKSPMTAWLLEHLKAAHQLAVLSRGYGRKTTGFVLADQTSTATQLGDEPLMYYKRFGSAIQVAVCEDRTTGIKRLLQQEKPPQLIVLDDAYQHRKVKAGMQLVLSEYAKPFYSDYLLPMGRLRESRSGIHRADALIFTKCPETLSEATKQEMIRKSGIPAERVFFSTIAYGELIHFAGPQVDHPEAILLVTGIANPQPLEEHLKKQYRFSSMRFADHHHFSASDLAEINKKMVSFANDKRAIVCTEKDYVRLAGELLREGNSSEAWYYQPMTIRLDRESEFIELIKNYVGKI